MAKIRSGRATQAAVAAHAGVSGATVSYVLNGRADRPNPVSDETRARVMASARELGYQPNRAGRMLRRGRTELIAVVHAPPTTPWLEELSRQLETAADAHGTGVVHLLQHGENGAARITDLLAGGLVDAAILVSVGLTAEQRGRLARSPLALTFVDESIRPRGFDVVRQHIRDGMRLATEALTSQGRRRIAFLDNGDRNRYAGFEQGLNEAGLEVDPTLVRRVGESRDEMLQAALSLLSAPRSKRPDALLSGTDRGAIAALWAARSRDLVVPDDLAVIGAGNIPEGIAVRPALTTVGPSTLDFQPVLDRLFARIADPDLPGMTINTPWQVVQRDSA